MKQASILACALLFASVATFAQAPPSQPLLTQEALAAILGQPAAGSCGAQPNGVRQAARRPAILTEKALCTATASCQYGIGTVSCSSNVNKANCMAVNAVCTINNDEPGHVTCDGHTTSCHPCCHDSVECCMCELAGDCFNCCRCDGGSKANCALQCG
jgi:hypothetical protein